MVSVYRDASDRVIISENRNSNQETSITVMIPLLGMNGTMPGLAHLIEHVYFDLFSSLIDASISIINALTTKENLFFYFRTTRVHLISVLTTITRVLSAPPSITDDIKKVVIHEIEEKNTRITDIFDEELYRISFSEAELSSPIMGTVEQINGYSNMDAEMFYTYVFVPHNQIISICGPNINQLTKEVFPHSYLPHTLSNNKPVYETSNQLKSVSFINTNDHLFRVNISYISKHYSPLEENTAKIITACLGKGPNSLLFSSLRTKLSAIYSINVSFSNYGRKSITYLSIMTHPANAHMIAKMLCETLYDGLANAIDPCVFGTMKRRYTLQELIRNDSCLNKSLSNALHHAKKDCLPYSFTDDSIKTVIGSMFQNAPHIVLSINEDFPASSADTISQLLLKRGGI